mmetsp:Transcript_187/g.615  ORF Transcript_187/g.615 Transcript_187/m.615 type:complete len:224 (-) Transcript_187:246-917(-)
MRSTSSSENTPTSAYGATAGLSMGPSTLNAVRTFSARRMGTTDFIAGWYRGANMKPTFASLTQRATASGPRSTSTPSASSTSAEPQSEETERLPCLATWAPAPAQMMQAPVEMFTVPAPSPPVPTMSSTSSPASTRTQLLRIAFAMPAISAGVSPLARRSARKAENWVGSAAPFTSSSTANSVSCAVRSSRRMSFSSNSRKLVVVSAAAAKSGAPSRDSEAAV